MYLFGTKRDFNLAGELAGGREKQEVRDVVVTQRLTPGPHEWLLAHGIPILTECMQPKCSRCY
jgi:hypothetical protein